MEKFSDCPSPSKEPVGISKLIPLNVGSIWGTGGGCSVLIFRSNSADLFLKPPPHLRSDQRDPGRDPGRELGRELGREPASLMTMLGTLRSDGAPERSPSDRDVQLSPLVGVIGINPPSFLVLPSPARAVAGRSSGPGDAGLSLKDRPLASCSVSSGVGREAERMASGR